MRLNYLALTLLLIAPGCTEAQQPSAPRHREAPAVTNSPTKCGETSCGNTPTGEDPQEYRIRKGREKLDLIAASNSDKERWTVPLFSDSKKPKDLELYISKSAGLLLKLRPPQGLIQFDKNGSSDVFEIGSPQSSNDMICRGYFIKVIDGSPNHALIEKACTGSEYKPGRYHIGTSYFLYDNITHSMRPVWESSSSLRDAPAPALDRDPMISINSKGYEIRWNANYVRDGKKNRLELHNRYTRETTAYGKNVLLCVDLLERGKIEPETGACDGGTLPRVDLGNGR